MSLTLSSVSRITWSISALVLSDFSSRSISSATNKYYESSFVRLPGISNSFMSMCTLFLLLSFAPPPKNESMEKSSSFFSANDGRSVILTGSAGCSTSTRSPLLLVHRVEVRLLLQLLSQPRFLRLGRHSHLRRLLRLLPPPPPPSWRRARASRVPAPSRAPHTTAAGGV